MIGSKTHIALWATTVAWLGWSQWPVAAGQAPEGQLARPQLVERACHAQEVTSGPEVQESKRVHDKLSVAVKRNIGSHHINVAVVNSNVINAYHVFLSMTESFVCLPIAIVRFMGSDGEFAFVTAHELGHALDDTCKTADGRAALVTPSGRLATVLGALLDQSSPRTEQQACEARADEIGFNLLIQSGYNPFDAAGAFGRLEMYGGDTGTGLLARFAAMGSDHPMTPDRISHMRALLTRNAGAGSQ